MPIYSICLYELDLSCANVVLIAFHDTATIFLFKYLNIGKIRNRGLEYLESEFPLLDYITQCNVMARNVDFV